MASQLRARRFLQSTSPYKWMRTIMGDAKDTDRWVGNVYGSHAPLTRVETDTEHINAQKTVGRHSLWPTHLSPTQPPGRRGWGCARMSTRLCAKNYWPAPDLRSENGSLANTSVAIGLFLFCLRRFVCVFGICKRYWILVLICLRLI